MKMLLGFLLVLALSCGAFLPGGAAYIGAYIAMAAAFVGLCLVGWSERDVFYHPVSLSIIGAIGLVLATLPFVYRGQVDLMAPVFILPMLTTIGLAAMGRPAGWLPDLTLFALLCLVSAFVAMAGGVYEAVVTDTLRVGMGNNPIHYGSLAVMVGGLTLVGIVSSTSPWRYVFVLGPVFGVAAAILSGSRGPLAGAVAMAGVGIVCLLIWNWRDRALRFSILAALVVGAALAFYLMSTGSGRVGRLLAAIDIFRFTGGSDDIRAALYASALQTLESSPIYGIGFGQLMEPARVLYPEFSSLHRLDNLHADWANFATMAGGLGLLAWLLLLLAPLALLRDPVARADRATVFGAVLLVTGQAALGVSNAMFGVLPQMVLFAVVLGYFFARVRYLRAGSPAFSALR